MRMSALSRTLLPAPPVALSSRTDAVIPAFHHSVKRGFEMGFNNVHNRGYEETPVRLPRQYESRD
jgi:hypothetical protein